MHAQKQQAWVLEAQPAACQNGCNGGGGDFKRWKGVVKSSGSGKDGQVGGSPLNEPEGQIMKWFIFQGVCDSL